MAIGDSGASSTRAQAIFSSKLNIAHRSLRLLDPTRSSPSATSSAKSISNMLMAVSDMSTCFIPSGQPSLAAKAWAVLTVFLICLPLIRSEARRARTSSFSHSGWISEDALVMKTFQRSHRDFGDRA
jgi:hypothetical protein